MAVLPNNICKKIILLHFNTMKCHASMNENSIIVKNFISSSLINNFINHYGIFTI